MQRKKSTWIVNYAGFLALICSFVIGSLVLINVGVHVYKNIVENNAENFRLRSSLSYVATKIRTCDGKNQISVREEEGIPVLVLKESKETGEYQTMIYCYDGMLCELYQEVGMEYKLADGLEIMELSDFQIEELNEKSMRFTVEHQGNTESLVMSLRSTQQ